MTTRGLVSAISLASAFVAIVGAKQIPPTGDVVTCGEDQKLSSPIPLTWPAVVLAGDGRLFSPCKSADSRAHGIDHRELREFDLINRAMQSTDPTLHWRGNQAFIRVNGGLGLAGISLMAMPGATQPSLLGTLVTSPTVRAYCSARVQITGTVQTPRRFQPGQLFRMMVDADYRVRQEAAYAIGTYLQKVATDDPSAPDFVNAVAEELRVCLLRESVPDVQGLILADIGMAPYATDKDRDVAEAFLVAQSGGPKARVLGAVQGIEALTRANPSRPIQPATRDRLAQLAAYGARWTQPALREVDARIRGLALNALITTGNLDIPLFNTGATDGDWQVRRLVASRLNLNDPEQARIGEQLFVDQAFQVRYELAAAETRWAVATHDCRPLEKMLDDAEPQVVMRVIDLWPATCEAGADGFKKITDWADALRDSGTADRWQIDTQAFAALVRLTPEVAKKQIATAAEHPAWQVRAAAASWSVTLEDVHTANVLANDPETNVRTAALTALMQMKSPNWEAAIDSLRFKDFRLLRTAADALKGVSADPVIAAKANPRLLAALRTATDPQSDLSRDARVALIDRLLETLPPPEIPPDLLPYTADLDDAVASEARKSGSTGLSKWYRYPFHPAEGEIQSLPSQALIALQDGTVTVDLVRDSAPVTVARFAALATQGFYNGTTFHRVVANSFVQGGSPGANDDMGAQRFFREEFGPQGVHLRGAIGMPTRGGDTGNGQFFIDLTDQPTFDRQFTVFGYVTGGMDLVDKLLEGAKILGVTVK